MTKESKERIVRGSGNVFADLDLADAEELQAKSGLVHRIASVIEKRGLTQTQTAALLGIDQPKVSNLLRGRLDGFSTERLFRFLNALGQDIEIVIRDKPSRSKRPAALSVVSA
jgi:predicted XRE-type DNA-binding protein